MLVLKLKLLIPGMHPQLVNWIQDFLTNRKQRVVIEGESPSELEVSSGVPKDSVLGLTLFLMVDCSVGHYAEDSLLYQPVDTIKDAVQFQNSINVVHQLLVA